MTEPINFIEWDSRHRQYLIRLAGNIESQEIRLSKMKAAEDLYEACKQALRTFEARGVKSTDSRYIMLEQALAKASK